jgi:hypothetical protein
MAETDFLCSNYSLQAAEPLPGTAPHVQVWVLLEYNGAWESKAFEASLIPEPVKAHLSGLLKSIPGSRLLLIRSRSLPLSDSPRFFSPASVRQGPGITLYIALAREIDPLLYRFTLAAYEDLLEMNLQGLVDASDPQEAHQTSEKLFLVCTHGRRDRCCARYGLVVFEALLSQAARRGQASQVWQCSHVGGHRFAANVLCFPHAIFYGRITGEEVEAVLVSYLQEDYLVGLSRGRACYPGPLQAAEIFLRQEIRLAGLMALAPFYAEATGRDSWEITTRAVQSGEIYRVVVQVQPSGRGIYPSCTSGELEEFSYYQMSQLSMETL